MELDSTKWWVAGYLLSQTLAVLYVTYLQGGF
jgi:hypothetical protein